jgi:hypothetical protein
VHYGAFFEKAGEKSEKCTMVQASKILTNIGKIPKYALWCIF